MPRGLVTGNSDRPVGLNCNSSRLAKVHLIGGPGLMATRPGLLRRGLEQGAGCTHRLVVNFISVMK